MTLTISILEIFKWCRGKFRPDKKALNRRLTILQTEVRQIMEVSQSSLIK